MTAAPEPMTFFGKYLDVVAPSRIAHSFRCTCMFDSVTASSPSTG